MHKVIFIDVESTGDGNDFNHGLLEIAMEYWIFYEDGKAEQIDLFYVKIKPNNMFVYQELNGKYGQKIMANYKKAKRHLELDLPGEEEAYHMLTDWLDKHIRGTNKRDKASLYAFNSQFDMKLLRNFFERHDSNFLHSYFYSTDLCVGRLAAEYVGSKRHRLPGERLQDFCRHFEIPVDKSKLHFAYYDVELTRLLYFKTWKLIQKKLEKLVMTSKLKDDNDTI